MTKPRWRQVYDAVEGRLAPCLESLVQSGEFSRTATWAAKARGALQDQVEGVAARLWHVVNLPAATDIRRLHAQVGALDREVRRLTLQLEQR